MSDNAPISDSTNKQINLDNLRRGRPRKQNSSTHNSNVNAVDVKKKTLSSPIGGVGGLRKSLRIRGITGRSGRLHGGATSGFINIGAGKYAALKSRSRRHILKKANQRYTVGDIVSLIDIEGGQYYAQLRALVVDLLGNSSCALTWLIPKQPMPDSLPASSLPAFNPDNFVVGPDDELIRDLDCCRLVCHCPPGPLRPIA